MDRLSRNRSTPAGLHLLILALALLARTFVPAGYMISPAASGAPLLTLCSGSGPVATTMAGHDKTGHASDRSHHGDGSGNMPCPFVSLLAAATTPPPLLPVVPPSVIVSASSFPADIVATGRGLAAPPPPSTGPPFHS